MDTVVTVEELKSTNEQIDELAQLLTQVVEDGASIGFLPPLSYSDARSYWEQALSTEVKLWVARVNDEILGSIQLHLCTKKNGNHRAEIAKLMTDPKARRKGIGRLLMQAAEERARMEGISLIVLDTREGDPSNLLYQSLGYLEAGRIPNYARSANGELHATVYYYKII
ncbi:GNAT family N-acetyltransferase [Ammoniphilus sp. CFH 90114]|uniref:GNAT family N-acetyltransferase n=1 Tax=Ammoniphilus sp. CFH 90114 TaxID=2493665 RepID=UPI00100F0D85|nr:GNAT family N-acetyltransferase [Ammoniphilus sp. CFH 90114]RXT03605.1 GNAT family N-acetyltransferase [Ammoniphilus sp. CFH 90114]